MNKSNTTGRGISRSSVMPGIDRLPAVAQQPVDVEPYRCWQLPDGSPWAWFYRIHASYLVRFPDAGDFTLSHDGLHIAVCPIPGVDDGLIEYLLLNQALPLALSRQHHVVLHAGAVEIGGGAVAFAGISGAGKSTLTTSFAKAGFGFLTDDGLQLKAQDDTFMAVPSHASVRLWEDSRRALLPDSSGIPDTMSASPKVRLPASNLLPYCMKEIPLRAIFLLGPGTSPEPVIGNLHGSAVVIELIRNSFLLDGCEPALLRSLFQHYTTLVAQGLCFGLDYPRRYACLEDVHRCIMAHIG